MVIINNNYTMKQLEHTFHVGKAFTADLKEVGIKFQPEKSQYYITEEYRNVEQDETQGNILNGVLKDQNDKIKDTPLYDITTYSVKWFASV